MVRIFDRNILIMMLAIMVGAALVTFFVANIINDLEMTRVEEEHVTEITTINSKNENFTSRFIDSTVLLDQAREDRAVGDYNFDLALLWYTSALSEKDNSTMELYKSRGIDNCTNAMPNYFNSYNNFIEANKYFDDTRSYTDYYKYLQIIDLYKDLTESGSKLTLLRCDACNYLKQLTENLTFNIASGNVTYLENVTMLLDMFEETLDSYGQELGNFEEINEEIDEYEMFDEIR